MVYGVNCGGTDNKLAVVYVTIEEIIDVDEIVQNHFKLSPNPANDFILINGLEQNNKPISYDFFDITGQTIVSNFLNKSSKINLTQLDAGIYIVNFMQVTKYFQSIKLL